MKETMLMILLSVCGVSLALAGAGGGVPGEVPADGLIQFDPPQAVSCVAVRVEVPDGKMVTGVRWCNGTSTESFPQVLVASGSGFSPRSFDEAIVIADDVQGNDGIWSELSFSDPVASESGTLFILLQYPENYAPQAGEPVLGVGYANSESTEHFFVTGDGNAWVKVSMACRVLMEPVLADRVPGVVALRARTDEPNQVPAVRSGLFAGPNPFNPETNIDLYLPEASSGTVKIFDVRGRLIVELYRGVLTKGKNAFVWRGRDARGRTLASGAYYVKADVGEKSWTKKLMLIK